jgi:hypothetical protein
MRRKEANEKQLAYRRTECADGLHNRNVSPVLNSKIRILLRSSLQMSRPTCNLRRRHASMRAVRSGRPAHWRSPAAMLWNLSVQSGVNRSLEAFRKRAESNVRCFKHLVGNAEPLQSSRNDERSDVMLTLFMCWSSLVSKSLWNISEICETCLKLVKNYLLFKICFTNVSHMFLKLVKHFLLSKFVLIVFQFFRKGDK